MKSQVVEGSSAPMMTTMKVNSETIKPTGMESIFKKRFYWRENFKITCPKEQVLKSDRIFALLAHSKGAVGWKAS
jgi:hypothetical protein